MSSPFPLGSDVHFVDRFGATREGRVVGTERLDDPRSGRQGWRYVVRADAFEFIQLPQVQIIGTVVPRQENAIFG